MKIEQKLLEKRYIYNNKIPYLFTKYQKKNIIEFENKISLKNKKINKCYICNSEYFLKISSRDRFGLYYPVVICKNCGLVQTNPYYNEKEASVFYSSYFRKIYMGRKDTKEDRFYGNVELGLSLIKLLKTKINIDFNNLNVLDVGCGNGGITKAFSDVGAKTIGIDLCDKSYFNIGIKNNLDLRQMDLLKFTKENPKYKADFIIFSHNVEHLVDPIKEFNILKKIIHEKTKVFICVPGLYKMKTYNYNYLDDYFQNAHKFHFSLNSLQNLMKLSGYKLIWGNEIINSVFELSKDEEEINFEDYLEVFNKMSKIEKIYQKNKIKIDGFRYINNFLNNKLGFTKKHYDFLRKIGITKIIRKIIFKK